MLEVPYRRGRLEPLTRKPEMKRRKILRIKTGVDVLERSQAQDQQHRAGQKQDGERNFSSSHGIPWPPVARVPGDGSGALLDRLRKIQARCSERGHQSRRHARRGRHEKRKDQHAEINLRFARNRETPRGESNQCVDRPPRSPHHHTAAKKRQQKVFRQQLPKHAPATRSQS